MQRSLLFRKFKQSFESLFEKYSNSLYKSINIFFLSFPFSNQKATQCLRVRDQTIRQLKKNMKSGPYMMRMVKRFT